MYVKNLVLLVYIIAVILSFPVALFNPTFSAKYAASWSESMLTLFKSEHGGGARVEIECIGLDVKTRYNGEHTSAILSISGRTI